MSYHPRNRRPFGKREYEITYPAGTLSDTAGRSQTHAFPGQRRSVEHEVVRGVLLDSLWFYEIESRRAPTMNVEPGTCTWLLKEPRYLKWLYSTRHEEHRLLWIKGKPGSGKSTLLKFALYDSQRTMKSKTVISFFFNARGRRLEKSTIGMYSALLFQIFERLPHLQSDFIESFGLKGENDKLYDWSEKSLKRAFEFMAQRLGESSLLCFIDAVDECDQHQIQHMVDFFDRVGRKAASAGIGFLVCLSARHYPFISTEGAIELCLENQPGHHQDIQTYINNRLCIGSGRIAEQVRLQLQQKADGLFLWVVVVIATLNKDYDCGRFHTLRTRLKEVPNDIYYVFSDILSRHFRGRYDSEFLLCLYWVLFAREPLKIEQLYFAILSGTNSSSLSYPCHKEIRLPDIKRFIINCSGGLVEITKGSDQSVQFIHESVEEYLLNNDGLSDFWSNFRPDGQGDVHEILKQCCLSYTTTSIATPIIADLLPRALSAKVEDLRQSVDGAYPFLEYAIRNIWYHANAAEGNEVDQSEFLQTFKLPDWVKLSNIFERVQSRRHAQDTSLLHILVEHDMGNLINLYHSKVSGIEGRVRYNLAIRTERRTEGASYNDSPLSDPPLHRGREHCAMPDTSTGGDRVTQPLVHDHYGTSSQADGEGSDFSRGNTWLEHFPHSNEDQSEDSMSVYAAGSNEPSSRTERFVSEIAHDTFVTAINKLDGSVFARVIQNFPEYLKAFALKIERLELPQIYRDVTEITRNIEIQYRKEEPEDDVRPTFPQSGFPQMALDDRMKLWYQKLATETSSDHRILEERDEREKVEIAAGFEGTESDQAPEPMLYKELITGTAAYEWLINKVRNEALLAPAEIDSQEMIREMILKELRSRHMISRKTPPEDHQIAFSVDWCPVEFLREQNYDQRIDGLLEKVITVTGSGQNAQAITCLQYLSQTWPSAGPHILDLVQKAVFNCAGDNTTGTITTPASLNENNRTIEGTLPDKTKVEVCLTKSSFSVTAWGTRDSLAEIGELLAWLGAALRSSPKYSGVICCTPYIVNITRHGQVIPGLMDATCEIGFRFDEIGEAYKTLTGQCWHGLFRNPVVVRGFPIPRRSVKAMGLEIPLDMMAGLTRTRHVDTFDNRALLKGFCTMLVPTQHTQDVIIWHLLYNIDGSRISFLDSEGYSKETTTTADLDRKRHVVGWCHDAKCYAGATDAEYSSINRSWLRLPHARCRLKDVSVSLPKSIVGGESTVQGQKDIPVWIPRDDYLESLKWLSRQYIVLWDAETKRGWLVNGVSALLHLLYASLEFSKNDGLESALSFTMDQVRDSERPHTTRSAMDVLMDHANLDLRIHHASAFETKETPEAASPPRTRRADSSSTVWERVKRLLNLLEKLFDHQKRMLGDRGEAASSISRKDLEGWDFKDLATFEEPLFPRVYSLGAKGKGWVDLTRAICAVTLFGRGFGEVIQPAKIESDTCPQWTSLPETDSNLAVCVPDLWNIADRFGSPFSKPVRLTNDIIWCKTDYPTRICQCTDDEGRLGTCDFTQALLPFAFRKKAPEIGLKDWNRGAVVFGRNKNLRWVWGDRGPPVSGEAPPSSDESEYESESEAESDSQFHDTGLGSSSEPPSADGDVQSSVPRRRRRAGELTHEHYEVGIVCALSKELLAVRALFDSVHQELKIVDRDPNHYSLGRIGNFKVVAAGLPADDYGTNSATNVASHLMRSFPGVKFCLIVGVGGGVPSEEKDIRLGDIVVSTAVVQYDMGKTVQGAPLRMSANTKNVQTFLASAITGIRGNPLLDFNSHLSPLQEHLDRVISIRPEYAPPPVSSDVLFESSYLHHEENPTCKDCDGPQRPRTQRTLNRPMVHYGLIASGNQVVRDAHFRDRMGREDNVLCFEMEAAGVMSTAPCLVIRGICDYADSHKNNQWQEYASATAASYAKLFLSELPNWDN